jgi:anti-anti-sigma factor
MTTVAHFAATGRLDAVTSGAVEKELLGLLAGPAQSVDLDVSGLDYISSAGLRVLLVAAKAAKAKGGVLTVRGPKPTILEVIKISGFDRILDVQA